MMPSPVSSAHTLADQFAGLHCLIGNTPLIAVDCRYRGEARVIYAKQGSLNFTGSIKDRMALFIMEQAYRDGAIQPGARIAEATSGNTGISFAAVGRALGHPVTIFMPDWMSAERMSIIASFGAFLGALAVQTALGRDAIVVTVFPDSNKKYLSTDLLRSEPAKDGYLSPDVGIVGFRAVGRVCGVCADSQRPVWRST